MCLRRERGYSVQKTLLQTIHGPVIFPKTAALTPAHIASVFVGLEVGKFISKFFFFSFPLLFFQCLAAFFFCFLLWVNKQKPRSYRQLKYSTHPGSHSWHCTGILQHRAGFPPSQVRSGSLGKKMAFLMRRQLSPPPLIPVFKMVSFWERGRNV